MNSHCQGYSGDSLAESHWGDSDYGWSQRTGFCGDNCRSYLNDFLLERHVGFVGISDFPVFEARTPCIFLLELTLQFMLSVGKVPMAQLLEGRVYVFGVLNGDAFESGEDELVFAIFGLIEGLVSRRGFPVPLLKDVHEHREVRVLHELRLVEEILNFEVGVLSLYKELFELGFSKGRVVPAYYILQRCLLHYSIYGINQT